MDNHSNNQDKGNSGKGNRKPRQTRKGNTTNRRKTDSRRVPLGPSSEISAQTPNQVVPRLPQEIIREFFEIYSPKYIEDTLQSLLTHAMGTEFAGSMTPQERADWTSFVFDITRTAKELSNVVPVFVES